VQNTGTSPATLSLILQMQDRPSRLDAYAFPIITTSFPPRIPTARSPYLSHVWVSPWTRSALCNDSSTHEVSASKESFVAATAVITYRNGDLRWTRFSG